MEKSDALGLPAVFEKYMDNKVEDISKCSVYIIDICKEAKNSNNPDTIMKDW